MENDPAVMRAEAEALRFMGSLTYLTEAEKAEARRVLSYLAQAIRYDPELYRKVSEGKVRSDVLPAAAAMLTAFIDELVKAWKESGEFR